jgi:hypothetical protein
MKRAKLSSKPSYRGQPITVFSFADCRYSIALHLTRRFSAEVLGTVEENIKEAADHRLMAIEQTTPDSSRGDGKMTSIAVEEESQGSN